MEKKEIKKVLVANRGEIAIRIIRACHDLGLNTVAIYSKEDILSGFRTEADESYIVGESLTPLGAYLAIDEIVALAKKRGADAIHPGYGFLSENEEFARACEKNDIVFIGPPSTVLGQMGDKLSAKELAHRCNVPTIPGSTEPLKDADDAVARANSYGYPVILKAAAGGGGRGMRSCSNDEEVRQAFQLVTEEARKSFGNPAIFMEKFLVEPKHIEVQILADGHGNIVHLYERDCSLQRRYQKVVEFTPAFSVPESTLEKLRNEAVKLAKEVGYVSVGTVEFLVDKDNNHYFIEMNPRIQVEHTVTEMVTGIDLVRAQILVAEGEKQSAILRADAAKQAKIMAAEAEATSILKVQQAMADSLRMLNEAAPNDQVIKLKSLEAMQKIADGKATKIIIPSEIQGLAGLAASAKALLEDDKPTA